MARLYLTDALVRSLTSEGAAQRDVPDAAVPRLLLRVTSRGRKSWCVRYSAGGRKRRFELGDYPVVSLAHARKRAAEILAGLVDGEDPQGRRAAERRAIGFAEAVDLYLESKRHLRSWQQLRRAFGLPDLRPLDSLAARHVTRSELRPILRGIAARAPVQAAAIQRALSGFFGWAVEEEILDANPLHRFRGPGQIGRARRRFLSDQQEEGGDACEIVRFWLATREGWPSVRAAVRLWLLLGQRMEEIAPMRWADLKPAPHGLWWTIPEEDTKNRKPHRVPILGLALEEIERLRASRDSACPWVFPTRRRRPNLEFAPIAPHPKRYLVEVWERAELPGTQGRDLRRTWATIAASLGVDRAHIGRCLNHADPTEPAVTGHHYDLWHYDPQKIRAFELVDAHLRSVLAGVRLPGS